MTEPRNIPPADGQQRPADRLIHSRRVRRPRMVPFLVTGAVLGFVAGMLVAWFGPPSASASLPQELILLGAVGGLLGGLLGAIVFLVAEWAARR